MFATEQAASCQIFQEITNPIDTEIDAKVYRRTVL